MRRLWTNGEGFVTSDLPLLTAAGKPAAVNPDRRLRRAAAEAGWPVLRID